jgi:replicative DNA helicase
MSKSIIINEQQVLACFFHDPILLDSFEDNFFTNDVSKCIFDSLKFLKKNSVSFTTSTVVSECAKVNKEVTHELIESIKTKVTFALTDFDFYKKKLIDSYVKSKVANEIIKEASTNLISKDELRIDTVQNIIERLQWAIDTITSKNGKLLTLKKLMEVYVDLLEHRGDSSLFKSTGNSYLDEHLYGNGIPLGQFITIFSYSGMGKSRYVINCINGLINKQVATLYIPLEMGKFLSTDNLISIRTGIPLSEFSNIDPQTGGVAEYVLEAVKIEQEKLSKLKYFRIVDDVASISEVFSLAKDFKKELNIKSIVIVIDLITMLNDFQGDNKASVWQDAVDKFFAKLKESNDCGIAVVQCKRPETMNITCYDDCDKYKPRIEQIKNSSAFEERSRAIISVYRKKHLGMRVLGKDDPEVMLADDEVDVNILKQNMKGLAELKYLHIEDTGKMIKYIKET